MSQNPSEGWGIDLEDVCSPLARETASPERTI